MFMNKFNKKGTISLLLVQTLLAPTCFADLKSYIGREIDASSVQEFCPTCPTSLRISEESTTHSFQHYPSVSIETYEDALQVARPDRSTSVLQEKDALEDVFLALTSDQVLWKPGKKAAQL